MDAGKKECPKCRTEQSTIQFYKNKKAKDGLQHWCKLCMNEASKFNQGMKREKNREFKVSAADNELGYQIAIQELKALFEAEAYKIFVKYHKNVARAIFEFQPGGKHGKINRQATEGAAQFGVRSTESASIPDNGQSTR